MGKALVMGYSCRDSALLVKVKVASIQQDANKLTARIRGTLFLE